MRPAKAQASLRIRVYVQADQSLCYSLEYYMIIKLLTELHFEFLSLTEGYIGSSESTLVEMPLCWKSHVVAHLYTETML